MAIDRVRTHLKAFGIDDKIIELAVSTATVDLAAQALGVDPDRIAKSLSFKLADQPILIVAAGNAKIDNRKYKDYFASKAKMLRGEEVEDLIGHAIGGVCPFGVNEGVKIYLDQSLKAYETVFPACGSANSAIELMPEALETYTQPVAWIDVCKY